MVVGWWVVGGGGEVRRKGGRSVIVGESAPGIHSFRHTWRLVPRLRIRSSIQLPFQLVAPAQPSTISFLFASTAEKKKPCSPQNHTTRINVQFFYFREALCKSRNSKFAHKRVRAPLNLSPSQSFYSFIIFFHCHRSTGGALWTTTRINAWMLGSHERRQIYRTLPRPCPGSL